MNTATLPAPLLWTPEQPNRCACDDRYKPQLNRKGKLVKSRERAWRMAEQTRDPQCLQEQARAASTRYPPLVYVHHNDSRKANAGYPDVHLWAPDGRGSVYIELKKMRHDRSCDPSPAQVAKMASLAAAGHLVYLCRPCCLFTAVLDQIFAARAGMEPRGEYVIEALGAGTVLPTANLLPAVPELAATPPPRPRRPPRELPGTEPPAHLPEMFGVLVPMTAAATDPDAIRALEAWLRTAGFPSTSVPFPMRIAYSVDKGDQVVVQVRADDGSKVWRGGRTSIPFPAGLLQRLHADVVYGPAQYLLTMLEHAVPGAKLPEQDFEQQPELRVPVVCPETGDLNMPSDWAGRVKPEP